MTKPNRKAKRASNGMSDAAVLKATGKTWAQWFKILDTFPKTKTHTERAEWLWKKHLPKGWWCQMVTVTYEQAKGLRKKHQTTTGYQVNVNRTLPISVHQLYRWIVSGPKRKQWLKQKIEITTARPGKSVRGQWPDGTRIDINLYARGLKKSSIQLQHEKLPSQKVAKLRQTWWRKRLDALAILVG